MTILNWSYTSNLTKNIHKMHLHVSIKYYTVYLLITKINDTPLGIMFRKSLKLWWRRNYSDKITIIIILNFWQPGDLKFLTFDEHKMYKRNVLVDNNFVDIYFGLGINSNNMTIIDFYGYLKNKSTFSYYNFVYQIFLSNLLFLIISI